MRNVRQEFALRGGGRGLVRVFLRVQAFEHDDALGDIVVFRKVDPAEPAVGDHAEDLVLAGDDVARVQRGRRDAFLHLRGAGVFQRGAGLSGLDPRQFHHAVGDHPVFASGAAQLAEGIQGPPAGARGGVFLDGAAAQVVEVFEQAGHLAELGEVCTV